MPATKPKPAELIAGLTDEERAELLAELTANPADGNSTEASPRERAIASLLRPRDHMEGCPLETAGAVLAGTVEAWDERVVAPSPELRGAGLEAGDRVAVVRCRSCSAMRYLPGTVKQVLTNALTGGDTADDTALDETL